MIPELQQLKKKIVYVDTEKESCPLSKPLKQKELVTCISQSKLKYA